MPDNPIPTQSVTIFGIPATNRLLWQAVNCGTAETLDMLQAAVELVRRQAVEEQVQARVAAEVAKLKEDKVQADEHKPEPGDEPGRADGGTARAEADAAPDSGSDRPPPGDATT